MQTKKVQSKAFATRLTGQTADDRNTITSGSDGAAGVRPHGAHVRRHRRYQHEPGSRRIKTEVGAQPRAAFLIRGHSSRFQRRIFASCAFQPRAAAAFLARELSSCSSRAHVTTMETHLGQRCFDQLGLRVGGAVVHSRWGKTPGHRTRNKYSHQISLSKLRPPSAAGRPGENRTFQCPGAAPATRF